MDEWHRAITFIRSLDERVADQTIPFAWGRALVNRRLNLVHDANYLLVDHANGASAEALISEAERIQGAIGLSHRRVNVDDQEAALRLAVDFQARGYIPERFVIMVRHRPPDRESDPRGVEQVTWEKIRPARRRQRLPEPWAKPAVLEQLLEKHELTARLIPTRYFAAMVDGEVVSSCELRLENDIAQVETVETLEPFRNRGLARAVIGAALDAARGANFVFLVADHDDWPQQLYRRLGFDVVGLETRFLRLLGS